MANDQGAIKPRDARAIDSVLPIRDGAQVKETERRRVENKGLAKKQKKDKITETTDAMQC